MTQQTCLSIVIVATSTNTHGLSRCVAAITGGCRWFAIMGLREGKTEAPLNLSVSLVGLVLCLVRSKLGEAIHAVQESRAA